MSHPSPMKGKKLSEEEKEKRRAARKQREDARAQQRAKREAAERRRVATIESLIENENINPDYRARLVLLLREEYGRDYPKYLYY